MRPVRLTRLVILALLISGPWVSAKEPVRKIDKERQAVRAPATPVRLAAASGDGEMIRSWTVEGWGKTYEDAWQQALVNARLELLVDFDRRQQPLLGLQLQPRPMPELPLG